MSSETVESLNGERPRRRCDFTLAINTALTRCWGSHHKGATLYHCASRRRLGYRGRETTERVS